MSSKFKVQSSRRKAQVAKLPFVLVNMAMTADGKIATANRAVSSFGSARDHGHLLALRATADAVMAGARTVDSAPINLGVGPAKFRQQRLKRGLAEYPLRVIVSRSGSVNPRAKIFQHHFSPIVILTTRHADTDRLKRLRSVADAVKICGRNKINFNAAFRWLRTEWQVKWLLCEGGGELNAALFRAGLVDELHLTVCPKIFGGHCAPSIADGHGFSRLAAAERFRVKSVRQIGGELFTVFRGP